MVYKLDGVRSRKLEEVYPTEFAQSKNWKKYIAVASDLIIKPRKLLKNQWFMQSSKGTNSEYDSAKAFEKEGAEVNLVPFVTLNEEAIVKSVETMVDNIGKLISFLRGWFLSCG